MAKELLNKHEHIRKEERNLADEIKSHEINDDLIVQDFHTTIKRLNNTTRIIDYLRCLEILLKYRFIYKRQFYLIVLSFV